MNLIPNPSFEDFKSIPQDQNQIPQCLNWYVVNGTPDYFSTSSPTTPTPLLVYCPVSIPRNSVGFQYPKDGNFYAGILTLYRQSGGLYPDQTSNELIGTELIAPLKKKYLYNFRLYYNTASISSIGVNQLSAYFSTYKVLLNNTVTFPYPYNTQVKIDTNTFMTDTLNWRLLNGKFFAAGNEQYVSIGNFKNALHTKTVSLNTNFTPFGTCVPLNMISYTYLDSVSLYEIPVTAADCANDTTICRNDSVSLGKDVVDTARYSWQPSAGLSCTNCPNPRAKPLSTTSYILTKKIYGTVSYDTITVTVVTPPVAYVGPNLTICPGITIALGNDNLYYYTYLWQPTTALSCTSCGQPVANPTIPITYTLTKMACGLTSTNTATISIMPSYTDTPKLNLTNSLACLKDTLRFSVSKDPAGDNPVYSWSPATLFLSTSSVSANALIQNNTYYAYSINSATNSVYCPYQKRDSIYISIPDTCKALELVLPNIITPNGDGKNDIFTAELPGYANGDIKIFNRWGDLLYETSSEASGNVVKLKWDGTYKTHPCVVGTYYYIIEAEAQDGRKDSFRGFITLLK